MLGWSVLEWSVAYGPAGGSRNNGSRRPLPLYTSKYSIGFYLCECDITSKLLNDSNKNKQNKKAKHLGDNACG